LLDVTRTPAELYRVNVEGTRNVWRCSAANGVKRGIFCSSAAVYGLLRRTNGMIVETSPTNAIEPYGRTKFLAEREALAIGSATGLHTTIIRPVAIFGPGEHTPFGKKLRDAAVSKLLFAGGFQNKRFTFVHVEDVAEATIHLMQADIPGGEVFNIAADEPILYQDAFDAYIRVLKRAGGAYARIRLLALVSRLLHRYPPVAYGFARMLDDRLIFRIWRPGFDLLYSSAKLRHTSFRPEWNDFERVFSACLEEDNARIDL
jgi:nucleoside-diphosphate-sugar epimerase